LRHVPDLRWAQVKWPDRKPAEAWYECERCHERIADHHKPEMLQRGQWRGEAPGDGETAGFWLNGLYSPWTTWGQLAKDFLRARKSPERMQTFTNTVLAETFQQAGATRTDAGELLGRRQAYRPDVKLPAGVVLITLGADLQADRIELEIVGWGRDEESWSLAYIVLPGDPAQRDLWDAFDQVLSLRFDHPCGREFEIAVACVDSGFHQPIVQGFCNERQRRSAAPKMYPIKGAAGQRPIWPRMHSKAKDNRPLWVIGVDAAKEALYARLKITEPGPGFCHFPISDQYDRGLLRAAYRRDVPRAVQQGLRASRVDQEAGHAQRGAGRAMLRLRRFAIADRRSVPIEQAGRSDRGDAAVQDWRLGSRAVRQPGSPGDWFTG
jgi:phage terminase large subunit GpA-like protein